MSSEVDIITGFPNDPSMEELEKIRNRSRALQREMDDGAGAKRAMNSKTGKVFRLHCEGVLYGRIKEMVKSDPACQAILQVLNSIGIQTESAKVAARGLASEQLREERE
jgi:hypothetical protein